MTIFSAVVRVREDELMTQVLSLEAIPLAICLAVSNNSEDTKASKRPGKGFSPRTGNRPANSVRCTG